jgi:hypothetical protein
MVRWVVKDVEDMNLAESLIGPCGIPLAFSSV